jgi:serine protease Do
MIVPMVRTAGVAALAAGLALAPPLRAADEKPQERKDIRRIEMFHGGGGGRLGVRLSEVGSGAKATAERGALVASVEDDSPAEKAGLKDGDVIVRFDGEDVRSAIQLARLVRETPPGRSVAIEVSRDGSAQKVTATIGAADAAGPAFGDFDLRRFELPVPPPLAERDDRDGRQPRPFVFRLDDEERGPRRLSLRPPGQPGRLGIEFQEIDGQLARYFKVAGERGVLVTSVDESGPAGKAGVKAGDVIVKLDGEDVRSGADLREQVRGADAGKELGLTVQRDGRPVELKVTLPERGGKRKPDHVTL